MSANFRGKYTYGSGTIDFVVESVAQLVAVLEAADDKADAELLADIFWIPDQTVPPSVPAPKKKKGTITPPPPVPPPASRPKFRISVVAGGFSVGSGDSDAETPERLEIAVAYDTRTGNPLTGYDPLDFKFGDDVRLEPAPVGLTVVSQADNRIVVRPTDSEFKITATGFDPNRDLYVRVLTGED